MIIGTCRVVVHIPNSGSLKAKRHVIKGIIDRVRNQFNVSIAEVESQDLWQMATLGIACVNTETGYANKTLSKVVNLIESTLQEGYLVNYEIEIL